MVATALQARVVSANPDSKPGDYYAVTTPQDTDPTFNLSTAGVYMVEMIATFGGGSVALQVLGPDASTYLAVKNKAGTAVSFSAAGTLMAQLPAGSYKLHLA